MNNKIFHDVKRPIKNRTKHHQRHFVFSCLQDDMLLLLFFVFVRV